MRTMTKRAWVGLAILVMLLAACSSAEDPTAQELAANEVDEDDATSASTPADGTPEPEEGTSGEGLPIKIGAVLSLTGPGSTYGVQQERALKITLDDINAAGGAGGRPVELLIEDDETNPNRALDVLRSLIGEDIDALIGSGTSASCYAMEPLTEQENLLHYCMGGNPPPEDAPLYFTANEPPLRWLGDMPAYWAAQQGFKSIACIGTDDVAGQVVAGLCAAGAEGAGMDVVAQETFALGDTNVATQMTRIREADPDVIYVATAGTATIPVLRAMVQLGMDVPVWISSGSANYEVAELIQDMLPTAGAFTGGGKIQVVDQLSEDDPDRKSLMMFVDAFSAEFDQRPDLQAGGAADVLSIVINAIDGAGVDGDGAALTSYLEESGDYDGLMGRYDFSADDHRGLGLSGLVVRFTDEGAFELTQQYADDDIPVFVESLS